MDGHFSNSFLIRCGQGFVFYELYHQLHSVYYVVGINSFTFRVCVSFVFHVSRSAQLFRRQKDRRNFRVVGAWQTFYLYRVGTRDVYQDHFRASSAFMACYQGHVNYFRQRPFTVLFRFGHGNTCALSGECVLLGRRPIRQDPYQWQRDRQTQHRPIKDDPVEVPIIIHRVQYFVDAPANFTYF